LSEECFVSLAPVTPHEAKDCEHTGLGIPFACAMAKMHDGELDYESDLGK
jgi:hypothetical protein